MSHTFRHIPESAHTTRGAWQRSPTRAPSALGGDEREHLRRCAGAYDRGRAGRYATRGSLTRMVISTASRARGQTQRLIVCDETARDDPEHNLFNLDVPRQEIGRFAAVRKVGMVGWAWLVLSRALRERHAGSDVLAFFKTLDRDVPRSLAIHVVLDNLSAHKAPEVTEWLARPRQARWHLHFTPTSSSWLNLIEGWFSKLTEKRLRRGSFISLEHLADAIHIWVEHWNQDPKPFTWTARPEDILSKIERARATLRNNEANSMSDH